MELAMDSPVLVFIVSNFFDPRFFLRVYAAPFKILEKKRLCNVPCVAFYPISALKYQQYFRAHILRNYFVVVVEGVKPDSVAFFWDSRYLSTCCWPKRDISAFLRAVSRFSIMFQRPSSSISRSVSITALS